MRNFKDEIKQSGSDLPPKIVIMGQEGVGKSTCANGAPSPIFLCAENGLTGPEFRNTKNWEPVAWSETLDFLEWLSKGDHQYQTLVIDTVDWLESMLFESMCIDHSFTAMSDFGWRNGYQAAAMEFLRFLQRIETVQSQTGMLVVINSHVDIRLFKNPVGDDYDKYQMKICKEISGKLREWADAVLFAHFESVVVKKGNDQRPKGIGGSKRVFHTTHCDAWQAKNRYGMPETFDFKKESGMKDILAYIDNANIDVVNLKNSITTMADKKYDKKKAKEILQFVKTESDVNKLIKLETKMKEEK